MFSFHLKSPLLKLKTGARNPREPQAFRSVDTTAGKVLAVDHLDTVKHNTHLHTHTRLPVKRIWVNPVIGRKMCTDQHVILLFCQEEVFRAAKREGKKKKGEKYTVVYILAERHACKHMHTNAHAHHTHTHEHSRATQAHTQYLHTHTHTHAHTHICTHTQIIYSKTREEACAVEKEKNGILHR